MTEALVTAVFYNLRYPALGNPASTISATSSMLHRRSAMPAAMAGETRRDLWMLQNVHQTPARPRRPGSELLYVSTRQERPPVDLQTSSVFQRPLEQDGAAVISEFDLVCAKVEALDITFGDRSLRAFDVTAKTSG